MFLTRTQPFRQASHYKQVGESTIRVAPRVLSHKFHQKATPKSLITRTASDTSSTTTTTRNIMGGMFGKMTVEEPPHEVLLNRATAEFPYEIRRYHERFAAEVDYPTNNSDDGTPFRLLAKYIGVFGTPENEGNQAISMTAPVVKEEKTKGTAIAMTAPVSMQEDEGGKKTMQFILPKEFDSLDKIPKPTNPAVHIVEVPPAVGAVHRFAGSDISMQKGKKMADALVEQLGKDGVDLSGINVMNEMAVWGYNPPWTIPFLRRNEVWLPLTEEQVTTLMNEFDPTSTN